MAYTTYTSLASGIRTDIYDEANVLTGSPTRMSFAGDGVTASTSNNQVTVTIPGGSGPFDLHDDVTLTATIASLDRVLFSDEGAQGDPNRFTLYSDVREDIRPDIYDEATELATGTSRIIFAGDGVTASHTGGHVTVTIPGGGGGTPFDLFNDVSDTVTTLTPGDWLLAADVSITGEPNVRVGFGDLVETIRPTIYDETTELVVSPSRLTFTGAGITAMASGSFVTVDVPTFSIHDVTRASGFSFDDHIIFSDESSPDDLNSFATFGTFEAQIRPDLYDGTTLLHADASRLIFTGNVDTSVSASFVTVDVPLFDIHDDVPLSSALTAPDHFIFSPMRRVVVTRCGT